MKLFLKLTFFFTCLKAFFYGSLVFYILKKTYTRWNVIKKSFLTFKSFWLQESSTHEQFVIPMTREECNKLIESHFCYGNMMTCKDESCVYDVTPNLEFTWEVRPIVVLL